MVDTKSRIDFIGFASRIKKEDRQGSIEILTRVEGMSVTDEELAELRCLHEETAKKADEMLKGGVTPLEKKNEADND